jgi:type I restriction enzyme S subunit
MYYVMQSDLFRRFLEDNLAGSTIQHLYQYIFERFTFATPDPEEQVGIAKVLATVDCAIEKTEALIAKRQRIKTGMMQDLLSRGIDDHGNLRSEQTHEFRDSPLGRIPADWEVGGLEDYVVGNAGIKPGPFGSSLTKDSFSEYGYRVYGQEQVIGGSLDAGDYYIPERKFSELSTFAVCQGDVLISLVGTIGHVLIVPPDHHPGVINPRLLRFRPNPRRCRPEFLKALLLSQPVRLQLDAFATGGTMPVLSAGVIRKLRTIIVGVPEQERIAQAIDGSERVRLSHSRDLAKLRCVRNGLMQDLLTGKRRVIPFLTEPAFATS